MTHNQMATMLMFTGQAEEAHESMTGSACRGSWSSVREGL